MEIAISFRVDGQEKTAGKALVDAITTQPEELTFTLNGAPIETSFNDLTASMIKQIVDAEVSRRAMKLLMRGAGYVTALMALTAVITLTLR